MNLNLRSPVVAYLALGALLGLLAASGRGKGKKLAGALKGAAWVGGVAFVAPKLGVRLPGLPAGTPSA